MHSGLESCGVPPTDNIPTIGLVSLGCPKALVDFERIATRLVSDGYRFSADYHHADLILINTCGFITAAEEESLDAIGEALATNGRVIVSGCLGIRAARIRENYPEVLAILGPNSPAAVIDAIHQHLPPPQKNSHTAISPVGIKLTPAHYAYLKIAEGCNHRCTFCIIPQLRGELHSRPAGEILHEAEQLVACGVKELLIIAQDISAYGKDLHYRKDLWRGRRLRTRLPELAYALGKLGAWVRLHYVYPYMIVNELIALMAEGIILPYLDIPLQHASPSILRLMRRPLDITNSLARIHAWREICPELVLRSTFIVGFPGETENDFQYLLEFLAAAKLNHVGCFTYSKVNGASANDLPHQVPEEIKQERYARLMELQQGISRERLRQTIGQSLDVLVDKVDNNGAIARGADSAPEIDGVVYINDGQKLRVGEFYSVEIVDSDNYDRWGVVKDYPKRHKTSVKEKF